jgi:hypothetical protein
MKFGLCGKLAVMVYFKVLDWNLHTQAEETPKNICMLLHVAFLIRFSPNARWYH